MSNEEQAGKFGAAPQPQYARETRKMESNMAKAEWERRVNQLQEAIEGYMRERQDWEKRIDTDLYYGRGSDNPSLTTRVTVLEGVLAKLNENLRRISWLLVGILLTAIARLALNGHF